MNSPPSACPQDDHLPSKFTSVYDFPSSPFLLFFFPPLLVPFPPLGPPTSLTLSWRGASPLPSSTPQNDKLTLPQIPNALLASLFCGGRPSAVAGFRHSLHDPRVVLGFHSPSVGNFFFMDSPAILLRIPPLLNHFCFKHWIFPFACRLQVFARIPCQDLFSFL